MACLGCELIYDDEADDDEADETALCRYFDVGSSGPPCSRLLAEDEEGRPWPLRSSSEELDPLLIWWMMMASIRLAAVKVDDGPVDTALDPLDPPPPPCPGLPWGIMSLFTNSGRRSCPASSTLESLDGGLCPIPPDSGRGGGRGGGGWG